MTDVEKKYISKQLPSGDTSVGTEESMLYPVKTGANLCLVISIEIHLFLLLQHSVVLDGADSAHL